MLARGALIWEQIFPVKRPQDLREVPASEKKVGTAGNALVFPFWWF
jgi:hypothetical protein